jgi:outer membrane immunogenic protein
MRKLLLATAAIVAFAGSAGAADLAVKAPVYKAPPPVYYYSWTGCYVGGNGGGLWQQRDYTLDSIGTPFGFVGFAPVDLGSHSDSSWVAGFQVGCNYQFAGGWVVGIQGDYDWTDASGSHADTLTGLTTLRSHTTGLGSVTGRVGYAWDRFLGYVKGGAAWEHTSNDWFVTAFPGFVTWTSENRGGWTVGIGGEYAFTDWLTGFVEYDYYGFGTKTVTFPVGPVAFNIDIRDQVSVVKAGLNFKFGPGPVVARY